MKKIIIAILFFCTFNSLHAQTEKGDWLVGGRIDLNTGDNSTYIGFTPNAGTFVIDKLAVGGNLGIVYQKTGTTKNTQFTIGPFARYYFTESNVKPLLHFSVNYLSSKFKAPNYTSTSNGSNIFIGGGVAIFINENVSIDGLMGYSRTKYEDLDADGGFKLGIGFQVYLTHRQINNMKSK